MIKLPSTAPSALVISLFLLSSIQAWQKGSVSSASSAERKLDHIERNGALDHPDPAPTVLSEQEVNAYLASGSVQLPAGVQSLKLEGNSGNVIGRTRVDFDKVREGTRNANPLLSLFSGVHDVVITAQAQGSRGRGRAQRPARSRRPDAAFPHRRCCAGSRSRRPSPRAPPRRCS